MITTSISLSRGSGAPNQVHGDLPHTRNDNGLLRVRTALYCLRILPAIAPHPVQPNGEPACHSHFGNATFPTHRQVEVPTSPVQIPTHCRLRCFHQQETQQRVALLICPRRCQPALESSQGMIGCRRTSSSASVSSLACSMRFPSRAPASIGGDSAPLWRITPSIGRGTVAAPCITSLNDRRSRCSFVSLQYLDLQDGSLFYQIV